MVESEPEEAPRNGGPGDAEPPVLQGIGVALLLTTAAVFVALIAGRASYLSSSAATSGQMAIREEVKQAAAYVESIRYIWGVEVPRAVSLTEARFRAEELTKLARDEELPRSIRLHLAKEGLIQEELVNSLAPASVLGSDPKYRTETGFDPVRMLVDDRAAVPALLETDPDAAEERGEEESEQAVHLVAVTVLLALAFLFGCVARGFPGGRRVWLFCGFALLVVGLASAVFVEVV